MGHVRKEAALGRTGRMRVFQGVVQRLLVQERAGLIDDGDDEPLLPVRGHADGVDAYLVEFAICFKMHVPFGGPGRRIAAVKDVLQPLAVSGRKKRVKFFRRPGNLGGRQADEAYAVLTSTSFLYSSSFFVPAS